MRRANEKSATVLDDMTINAAGTGLWVVFDQTSWMLQNWFNVYLPSVEHDSAHPYRYIFLFIIIILDGQC